MKHIFTICFCLILSFSNSAQDEIDVSFESDSLTLYGTLTVPAGEGPFPIAVFVHGSGPQDRDQTIRLVGGNAVCFYPGLVNETIENFKDLALAFQEYGIAVLRYDKRTFTYGSSLDVVNITPYDFIDDVHAAIDYVKTRQDIDDSEVILLGHSQGANFIPIVANERDDVSTLISLAAPATPIDTLLAQQVRETYYRCENDTATGNSNYSQILDAFLLMKNGQWPANTPLLGAYPKFWLDWISITDSTIQHFNRVSQAVIFLQGTEDFNVPVSDAQKFESNLSSDSVDVYYLEGLNHHFTNSTEPTVAQVVPDTIFHWLEQNNLVATNDLPYKFSDLIRVEYSDTGIFIEIDTDDFKQELQVFNVQGQRVDQLQSHNGRFEIHNYDYAQGIYFLVSNMDGKLASKKILIR